jgi:CheY-like chemotaxis protein
MALRGDPGRLRQILVNLTSNAVKFTESGEVVVRIAPVGAATGDWATIELTVTDTGIGIDPADQRHVLEPFSQADASTTRRYGGTGLGLAICRQLAEAMGGSLSIESSRGHGSTFRVVVPLGREWDAGDLSPATPELAGIRTLVVDDNATARAALESDLAGWGLRPEMAGDGPTALARLAAEAGGIDPFRLAVVDMAMPGMDGLELAERITSTPALADTGIVMLTTGRPPDGATANRLGIVATVAKPVVGGDLKEALVRLVSASPPESAAGPGATAEAYAAPLTAPAVDLARGFRGRVLVVEDNTTNQMVALGLLSRLGFDAEVVSNGQQAVDAVARTKYDTVLMDCNMPVMDGYEATAAIRRLEGDGALRVPIVAMTASALVGDRERCLAAGMDDYVSKPVKLGDLGRILSRWRPPEPSEPAAADVVDGDQLASLRALDGGDGVFLTTLVESFLASSADSLRTLASAIDAGDGAAVSRDAHRFKGEAATLGASTVAALCAELEMLPAPVDRAAAGAVLARIEGEMRRVRDRLQAELGPAQVS